MFSGHHSGAPVLPHLLIHYSVTRSHTRIHTSPTHIHKATYHIQHIIVKMNKGTPALFSRHNKKHHLRRISPDNRLIGISRLIFAPKQHYIVSMGVSFPYADASICSPRLTLLQTMHDHITPKISNTSVADARPATGAPTLRSACMKQCSPAFVDFFLSSYCNKLWFHVSVLFS